MAMVLACQRRIMKRKLSAGDEAASYCTRCKLDLNHVIIAMVGEKIVKVKCKTCGSEHKFKGMTHTKRDKETKRRVSPKSRPDTTKSLEALWESSIAGAKGAEISYDMGRSYRVGDVIVHNIFGRGVVLKTYFRKCDVIFKDKERLLASSNT